MGTRIRRSARIAQLSYSSNTSSSLTLCTNGDLLVSSQSSSSHTSKYNNKRRLSSSSTKRKAKRTDVDHDDKEEEEEEEDVPSIPTPLSQSSIGPTVSISSITSTSSSTSSSSSSTAATTNLDSFPPSLPRDLESKIIKQSSSNVQYVIGVDEAGRGPLAGPVVAAAVIVPMAIQQQQSDSGIINDPFYVNGIIDSKKLTKEEDREMIFERLMELSTMPTAVSDQVFEGDLGLNGIRWAVSIIDAARIDEINILQATMEAMRSAVQTVIGLEATSVDIDAIQKAKKANTKKKTAKVSQKTKSKKKDDDMQPKPKAPSLIRRVASASVKEVGSYVVCSENCMNKSKGHPTPQKSKKTKVVHRADDDSCPSNDCTNDKSSACNDEYYALIDGNRVPLDMPCGCESVVKGDSKEFCIAAASIIAKVTRDRLMRGYDELYPEYNLQQHKGYPTAEHMAAVRTNGACPIHRRTFAPLKHMEFDENGRVMS